MKLEVGTELVAMDKYTYAPTVVKVSKVTPSKKFFYLEGHTSKFVDSHPGEDDNQWSSASPADRYGYGSPFSSLFPISELEKCQSRHTAEMQRRAEKQAQREAREAEYAARLANEMKEVKDACDNYLFGRVQSAVTLPDGSRLFTINMPVHPAYQEQKQFEILIVRLKDCKTFNDKGDVVGKEGSYTYINARQSSFSSCSNIGGDNEEEIVWECMRRQYHSL